MYFIKKMFLLRKIRSYSTVKDNFPDLVKEFGFLHCCVGLDKYFLNLKMTKSELKNVLLLIPKIVNETEKNKYLLATNDMCINNHRFNNALIAAKKLNLISSDIRELSKFNLNFKIE